MAKVKPPVKKKYIETPEKMWEYFIAYRDEIKGNPKRKNDFAGKDADEVFRKLERPLTMEGFNNYLEDNEIIGDVGDYFENRNNKYISYSAICSRIKRNIRQDQIEGGMVGIYNPSITQRLNSIIERSETKTEVSGGISLLKVQPITGQQAERNKESDVK